MKKNNSHQELQAQWERAIEQAEEIAPRAKTLGEETLNQAAGLQVKAGVKAGNNWMASTASCTGIMCC